MGGKTEWSSLWYHQKKKNQFAEFTVTIKKVHFKYDKEPCNDINNTKCN